MLYIQASTVRNNQLGRESRRNYYNKKARLSIYNNKSSRKIDIIFVEFLC